MKRLWAPWRMEYIRSSGTHGCLFCSAWRASDAAAALVLGVGQRVFVVLNRYPYNSGHLMVVPKAHVATLGALGRDDLCDLMRATRLCEQALAEEYSPQGFSVGMNIGACAGAGVPDHIHVHVVPRWAGDTNFMPVLGETKVLPETLSDTFNRLAPAVERLLVEEGL